jgi:hypothetical protein
VRLRSVERFLAVPAEPEIPRIAGSQAGALY